MNSLLYVSSIRPLDDPDKYDRAYSCASQMRKKKTDQYLNSEDKKRSLTAELLLKKALTDQGKYIADLKYEYNDFGKPKLKDINDFCFNISHSGDYVILAVSDKEIGCDIEKIRNRDLKIAKRFFAEKEYEVLSKIEDEDKRKKTFYLYWVLKESFIKFSGQGLSKPLDSFWIDIHENNKISVHDGFGDTGLYLKCFDIVPGYSIAVCSYDKEVDVIMTDLNELIEKGICL